MFSNFTPLKNARPGGLDNPESGVFPFLPCSTMSRNAGWHRERLRKPTHDRRSFHGRRIVRFEKCTGIHAHHAQGKYSDRHFMDALCEIMPRSLMHGASSADYRRRCCHFFFLQKTHEQEKHVDVEGAPGKQLRFCHEGSSSALFLSPVNFLLATASLPTSRPGEIWLLCGNGSRPRGLSRTGTHADRGSTLTPGTTLSVPVCA